MKRRYVAGGLTVQTGLGMPRGGATVLQAEPGTSRSKGLCFEGTDPMKRAILWRS